MYVIGHRTRQISNFSRQIDRVVVVSLEMMLGRVTEPPRKKLLTMDQRNSSQDIFISISGLIGKSIARRVFHHYKTNVCVYSSGAGKSTLATKLAEKMDLPCFYEPVVDNAYLADFYRDPSRYSFPLQV